MQRSFPTGVATSSSSVSNRQITHVNTVSSWRRSPAADESAALVWPVSVGLRQPRRLPPYTQYTAIGCATNRTDDRNERSQSSPLSAGLGVRGELTKVNRRDGGMRMHLLLPLEESRREEGRLCAVGDAELVQQRTDGAPPRSEPVYG